MTERAPKTYRAEGVEVTFDAALCRHAARCVGGLPEVFDTTKRPWIDPAAADPERIAEVVRRCPTGALTFLLRGQPEQPERPTSVTRTPDGRLLLRGDLLLPGPDGGERRATRAMLCGCGRSAGQPYCDRSGECAQA